MNDPFSHKSFTVRRKFWQFLGATIHIRSFDGQLIGNAKLKAFKLREAITLFADDARTIPLLSIKARTILDFGTVYDVLDLDNKRIGSLKRQGWKSIVSDQWQIWDADEQVIGEINEDNVALALVRRFLTNLIPQKFTLTDKSGKVYGNVSQRFNPLIVELDVKLESEIETGIDPRLTMVATLMLAAIEGRQG
ncbi:hypothetical protein KBC31_01880 [Candidatus Saccharibacteria bacterium]|nr:hypothetical protein [Candidatus Saccharibacteria bacterium]